MTSTFLFHLRTAKVKTDDRQSCLANLWQDDEALNCIPLYLFKESEEARCLTLNAHAYVSECEDKWG